MYKKEKAIVRIDKEKKDEISKALIEHKEVLLPGIGRMKVKNNLPKRRYNLSTKKVEVTHNKKHQVVFKASTKLEKGVSENIINKEKLIL